MKKNFRTWLNFLLIAGVVMILATSCKKDNNTDDPEQIVTVKDIDGNVYTSVTIGTQVWMVENLKTTKYRNGDQIPNVTTGLNWSIQGTSAYCTYNSDLSNGKKYGNIYNWYAVHDSRNIAPTGWHIPSDAEWETLEDYLTAHVATTSSTAKALAATTDWDLSDYERAVGNDLTKNNLSGFTALPGGFRFDDGEFQTIGKGILWWSSAEIGTNNGWNRYLYSSGDILDKVPDFKSKTFGLYVRCIKD